MLSFVPEDVRRYGRVIRNDAGDLVGVIVEAADATPAELAVREANSSIYVFSADALWPALERLTPANAQGELYLTDAVRGIVEAGLRVGVHVAPDPAETDGVNTRGPRGCHSGAARSPEPGAHARGRDDRRPAVDVDRPDGLARAGRRRPPLHGPTGRHDRRRGRPDRSPRGRRRRCDRTGRARWAFCYLRPGTVLGASSKAGTFVELKNTRLGEGTKVPHLAYLGDAEIGDRTNVGAGSITATTTRRGRRGARRSADVRVGVDIVFSRQSTLETTRGWRCRHGRDGRRTRQRPGGVPPRQVVKEGRGDAGTIEQAPRPRAHRGARVEAGSRPPATPQKRLMVFSGRSHPELAERIAERLGVDLGEIELNTFPNDETYCRYCESIRGADVFFVQTGARRSTST